MLRDGNVHPPDWLVELANHIRDLIWKYQARARFQRTIQAWRAEKGEGASDFYGRLPDRELELDEKYVLLAAIHDQCCKGVKKLNPWPDPRNDPAKRAAIKRRGNLTHPEMQTQLAATPFYCVRHGVQTSMPESDVANVEQVIREVEEDLKLHCAERGKEVRSSSIDEPKPSSKTIINNNRSYTNNDNRTYNESHDNGVYIETNISVQNEAHIATESTSEADDVTAAAKPGKSRRERGRPPDTDADKDRRLHDEWKNSGYRTYAEFCAKKGYVEDEVRDAVDRHRKRLKKSLE